MERDGRLDSGRPERKEVGVVWENMTCYDMIESRAMATLKKKNENKNQDVSNGKVLFKRN